MNISVNYQHQLDQKQYFFRKGLERTWDAQSSERVEQPWKPVAIVAGALAAAICLLLLLTGGFVKKPCVYVDGQRYVVDAARYGFTVEPPVGYACVGETFYSEKPKKETGSFASDWTTGAAEVWRDPDNDFNIYLHSPGCAWVEARKR